MKHPLTREYKMMLKPQAFVGSDATRAAAVAAFWQRVERNLTDDSISAVKHMALASTRQVTFLDTPDRQLYDRFDLILRLRQKLEGRSASDVTLKFRHGDRLQAAAQPFRPRKAYAGDGRDVTFEEDVKALPTARGLGFWALFSRSARAQIEEATMLSTVKSLGRVYGRLPAHLAAMSDLPLAPVGELVISEEVYDGGRFNIADARADAAVILWLRQGDPLNPIAAELSFRFDLHKGRAEPALASEAWRLFQALNRLDDVDPEGQTKTALVYAAGQP
jgi:hypothetical protein